MKCLTFFVSCFFFFFRSFLVATLLGFAPGSFGVVYFGSVGKVSLLIVRF